MPTPTLRPLGAQLSHMLKDRGVDVIFGIPGVHNQEMYRGIEEANITHVLARHEQGAGFMADGYARATGKPGVAYVITGPGLCNIMTPMGQAYSDSVPLLVLSSCLDETAATQGQLHQMRDQEGAARTVCDWSKTANTAQAAYELVDRAFAEFAMKRTRSLHVQVPIALLEANAPPAPPPADTQGGAAVSVDHELAAHIAAALHAARRPVFVLGGGARGAASELSAVAEICGAAVFTTYAGRGVVSAAYSLSFGSYLARPDSARVIAQSDLVVAVGTELAEVDLWRDTLGHTCPMIRVDIDPANLCRVSRTEDRNVLADAAPLFADVRAAMGEAASGSEWTVGEVEKARAQWRAEADAERPGIVPVCDALRDCLPDDVMIYSDMTQFAYTAKEVWDMNRSGHWHHPYGFGTLGYALPAGIGGAVARRNGNSHKPTLVIAGDYGFQYTVQELGTAVELGLPLPIILWDNGKLKEIEDSMVRAQIAPNAVVARNPDFCKLAEAYGAKSAKPSTLAGVQDAVLAALRADGPTLIYLTPAITKAERGGQAL